MDKKQRLLIHLLYNIEKYEKEAAYAQTQIDFLTPTVKDYASAEFAYTSNSNEFTYTDNSRTNLSYWREVRDDALYELEGYEYILNNFKKNKINFK